MNISRVFARILNDRHGVARVIGAALVCAIGARIVAPGINGQALADFFRSGGAGPLLRLYDWLAGGAVARGALFALGAMPYIAARIYLRLAPRVVPSVRELARRRMSARGLTLGFALVQSYGFARFAESIPGVVANPGMQFVANTMLVLTGSAMAAMWLCEMPSGDDAFTAQSDLDNSDAPLLAAEQSTSARLIATPLSVAEVIPPGEPVVIVRK